MNVILVVDDDAAIRQLVELRLRHHGFPTMSVRNVKEALLALRTGPRACLILLDVMMPGETGWDLVERLARDPALASIPVTFMTASPIAIEAHARTRGGRFSMIPKPLNSDRLISAAEAHCTCRSTAVG